MMRNVIVGFLISFGAIALIRYFAPENAKRRLKRRERKKAFRDAQRKAAWDVSLPGNYKLRG